MVDVARVKGGRGSQARRPCKSELISRARQSDAITLRLELNQFIKYHRPLPDFLWPQVHLP